MTMTKKRLLLIASLPLTIVVTLGIAAILPPGPGVTKANFGRIEKGMTEAEVEAIFGVPAHSGGVGGDDESGIFVFSHWHSDDGADASIVTHGGIVCDKNWTSSPNTFLDKIRRWLHLP